MVTGNSRESYTCVAVVHCSSAGAYDRGTTRLTLEATVKQAYDGHMNMILSDVEETIYVVETDEVTNNSVVRVRPASLWVEIDD